MNQQNSEREWLEMQLRINGMFKRYFNDDVPAIEHKSDIAGLLQAPAEYAMSSTMDKAE